MTPDYFATRALLLRRNRAIFVLPGQQRLPDNFIETFEINLAAVGYAVSTRLRARLQTCSAEQLTALQAWTGKVLLETVGGNRKFTPLYRRFPEDIPANTFELWCQKVLTYFMQQEDQPCLHCHRTGTTHVLNPCRHIVCDACFDGANYSACPVCSRQVDAGSAFFKQSPALRRPMENTKLQLLDLGPDLDLAARALFVSMCERKQAMSPVDNDDFLGLIRDYQLRLLAWLPAQIPVRENIALLFGTLLQVGDPALVMQAALPYINTATDVLRLVAAYSGADPALQGKEVLRQVEVAKAKTFARFQTLFQPGSYWLGQKSVGQTLSISRFKVAKLGRPLRRALLGFMEGLHPESLTEDMLRHRSYWVWLGEFLHPGEFKKRFPQVDAAFKVIRKKDPAGKPAAPFLSYYAKLEKASLSKDAGGMTRLLLQRPGELGRRFDHALRVAGADSIAVDAVLAAFEKSASRFSTPVLLTLGALLPTRAAAAQARIYWPKGRTSQAVFAPDTRPPLSAEVIARVLPAIDRELLERFGALPRFHDVVIDAALQQIVAPFNERTASRGAIQLPRGSTFSFATGKQVRLFLHWCEPEKGGARTDLDLSVGLYDARWNHMGTCSYYELSLTMKGGDTIARSAGDLTSAPFPDGASEFIDIDCALASKHGARYAVAVLNNYAGMPFGDLEHAYAGLMFRDDLRGAHFDPRTVELKFDLQGGNGIFLPLVFDMTEQKIHWLDVYSRGGFAFNNVATSNGAITTICPAMIAYFASGVRTSMYDLGLLHAAARAERVTIRDTASIVIVREVGESNPAFLARLRNRTGASGQALSLAPEMPVLALLLNGDLVLPEESSVYALKSGPSNGTMSASDLIA